MVSILSHFASHSLRNCIDHSQRKASLVPKAVTTEHGIIIKEDQPFRISELEEPLDSPLFQVDCLPEL